MVENNFGILKKTFQKLMIKSNLNFFSLLNVLVCYCILHNMILNRNDVDINELMLQLVVENVPKGGNIHGELRKDDGQVGITSVLVNDTYSPTLQVAKIPRIN